MTTDSRKKGWREAAEILLPGFLVIIIFLTVMIGKGIIPFGENRLDYYDMGQQNVPLYHHIWDALHGRGSFLYTWYINMGQNMVMAGTTQWNLSLLNLFFLLIPREYIYESMAFVLMLKLFFMSVNMCVFLRGTIRVPVLFRTLFSMAYGLCGYTLTHSSVPPNLDMAVFFPLLMLFLYRLLAGEEKKRLSSTFRYALLLCCLLVLSYYTGFINLIFVLLSSGAWLLLLCEKEKRGAAAARLGLGTFSGIALASFWLLPAYRQMSKSARLSDNQAAGLGETVQMIIRAVGTDQYYIKGWQLCGSAAALAVILAGLLTFRKEKRINAFVILYCFFPCAMIPFESIDLIWHAGTYTQYPIRCGYIISFVLLSSAAYYAGRFSSEETVLRRKSFLVSIAGAAAVNGAVLTFYFRHDTWPVALLFRIWTAFFGILFLAALYGYGVRKKTPVLLWAVLTELVCTSFVGYGYPHFSDPFFEEPQQKAVYIPTVRALKKEMEIEPGLLSRIKNPDTSLNVDYSWLMERGTVSGWSHTTTTKQLAAVWALGRSTDFLRMLDSGGTLFSDALFHVTQTLTCEPFFCENSAYELSKTAEGYGLYNNLYTLPFAMPVSSEAGTIVVDESNPAELNNRLYRAISGTDGDIMQEISETEFTVQGEKALYLKGGSFEKITVNGKTIPVPTIGDMKNTAYPANFNRNAVFAGIYRDEAVKIEGRDEGRTFLLDLEKLRNLCDSFPKEDQQEKAAGRKLSFSVNCRSGTDMVMIPVCFDPGFTLRVNGAKKEAVNVAEIFTGIPVEEGMNQVELTFLPDGMLPGAVVSAAVLLLMLFCEWKKIGHKVLDGFSAQVLSVVWAGAVIVIYVIPIMAFFIHQIVKRL